MGFNLTQYNHVEKFTLRQSFERLKQEGISIDIAMMLIFEELIDFRYNKSKIPLYGQHNGGYRFDTQFFNAEIGNICNIYERYRNPENPQSYSSDYSFDDNDGYILDTYFFDKKEFLDFFHLPYNAESLSKSNTERENFEELQAKITNPEDQIQEQQSTVNSTEILLVENKNLSPKSETSYLNIIQALKDELLATGRFKNQAELISFLSDKYTGYTGLTESNLRDKFAKANQIK